MKIRKLLAIVLAIVMMVSILSTGALAAGDPTFKGDTIKAKAGDTITYNVYIENNPGIAGYKVQVDFSDEAFDLVGQDEDEFENTIEIEMGDFSLQNDSWGNVVSNTTAYGCVVLWFNTENVTNDGVAFKVILKVADDAINGEHAVKIRCDAINTVDEKSELVAFKTVDGSVTVSGGVDGIINNDEVGPSEEELEQMASGTLSVQGNPIEENKPANNDNAETDSNVEASDPMNVNKDNNNEENPGEDVDAPANGVPEKEGGLNVVTLILIIAAAIVAVAVVAIIIVKGKGKKKSDVIGVIPGDDEREMEIEEVMGWDEAEEDDEDDED